MCTESMYIKRCYKNQAKSLHKKGIGVEVC